MRRRRPSAKTTQAPTAPRQQVVGSTRHGRAHDHGRATRRGAPRGAFFTWLLGWLFVVATASSSLHAQEPLPSYSATNGPSAIGRQPALLNSGYIARCIAEEPASVRLPAPLFIPLSGESGGNLAASPITTLDEIAPSTQTAPEEPTIELATPPDGPRRRGFFAHVFGPGIEATGEVLSDVRFDYMNFYSGRSLLWLGTGIGVAAVLANTKIDQHFQNWYQADVRSNTSDQLYKDIQWLGNGGLMVPIWVGTGLLLTPLEEHSPAAHAIGTWGRKSTRAFLVGGPMLLALQYGLGAHRPSENINSYWHPFQDTHGASGDAWVGAITFLTAAKMTDSKLAKVALWSLALFPAWGRLNVDQHYLSQVTLGVWVAALSVEAVDRTDRSTNVFIVPSAGPDGVGATLGFRW